MISITYTYFVSVSSKKLGLLTSFGSISLDDKFEVALQLTDLVSTGNKLIACSTEQQVVQFI